MPGFNRNCNTCKKKFYTSKQNEHCRPCMRDLGLLSDEQNKRILQRIIKDACGDAKQYKTEIFLYSVKQKWNMLTQLDYYKIADLYLKIICDGFKYSQNEPENQVIYMLADLRTLLMEFPTKKRIGRTKGKGVIQLTKDGKIKKQWKSIKSASEALDLGEYKVKALCNRKIKNVSPILYWANDYKPS